MSEFLEHIKRDLAAVLAAQAMPETNDVEENAKRAAEAEASYNICSNTEQRLTKLLAVAGIRTRKLNGYADRREGGV